MIARSYKYDYYRNNVSVANSTYIDKEMRELAQ